MKPKRNLRWLKKSQKFKYSNIQNSSWKTWEGEFFHRCPKGQNHRKNNPDREHSVKLPPSISLPLLPLPLPSWQTGQHLPPSVLGALCLAVPCRLLYHRKKKGGFEHCGVEGTEVIEGSWLLSQPKYFTSSTHLSTDTKLEEVAVLLRKRRWNPFWCNGANRNCRQ